MERLRCHHPRRSCKCFFPQSLEERAKLLAFQGFRIFLRIADLCACKDYLTKHYQQRNILSEVRTLKRDEWLGSVPAYVRVSRKNGRNTPPLGTEGGGGQGKPEGGGDTGLVGNWVSHGEQS